MRIAIMKIDKYLCFSKETILHLQKLTKNRLPAFLPTCLKAARQKTK